MGERFEIRICADTGADWEPLLPRAGCIVALSDGGMMSPEKLQQTLEQTMEHFERSALELRRLCEQYSPGVGGYGNRARRPAMEIAGHVEILCEDWRISA